jgi:hypothetical protein
MMMPDIKTLYAAATTVTADILVRVMPYRIMYAQKCVTPDGVRLLKLRADPRNIFVKMPAYDAYLFTDSQISRINNEQLFVNIYLGRNVSGNPIIQIRNAAVPMPTHSEMLAARAVGY